MRKFFICVLVGLMLVGTGFFMTKGMSKIKGINDIKEKNDEIDKKISELDNVVTVTYQGADSNLKNASNRLVDSKTEYENQAALSSLNSSSYASKLESYDIEFLWTKLGNYAKDENVVIKIDVTSGGESANLYNLNFTVVGTYVGTTDFIYDIENDSKLGFKIDNFKMTAGSSTEVNCSFVCKDIPLSVGNIENSAEEKTKTEEAQDSQTSDTTNTLTDKSTTGSSKKSSTSKNSTSNTEVTSIYDDIDPNKSNLTN